MYVSRCNTHDLAPRSSEVHRESAVQNTERRGQFALSANLCRFSLDMKQAQLAYAAYAAYAKHDFLAYLPYSSYVFLARGSSTTRTVHIIGMSPLVTLPAAINRLVMLLVMFRSHSRLNRNGQ